MSTALDNYGELTALKFKAKQDLTFQTADANSVVLRCTDSSGGQVLTIPSLDADANLLTDASSLAVAKLDINGAQAETSLADTDEFVFFDASAGAGGENRKVTGANLKTYVGAGSGVPSGTSGQMIVYDGTNSAAAVSMSSDATLDNTGALTIANNAITSAKIQAGAVDQNALGNGAVTEQKLGAGSVTQAKIGASAVVADKLATDAVTSVKIQNDAVTSAKIQNNAVTDAKIDSFPTAAGTVEISKICVADANKDLDGFRNLTSTGSTQSNDFLVGTSQWKIVVSGSDLAFQHWNGSSWVTKQTMSSS